ncbi:MAG: SUMF1/EgtB/PvdO family nonheme iron enzyme, partial [Deltaproteobacteria bacterium]|nr:SUMF1/EgtB/PvdO family nonheme iron enzyme [Deltaproteobacteria bacterium]
RTDPRADVYALGKILYEAVAVKITHKTVPFKSAGLDNAETPFFRELDQIIRKATAEDRKERFGSVADMRKALLKAIEIAEKTTSQDSKDTTPGKFRSTFSHVKWIWPGITIVVLSVGLVVLWLLLGDTGKQARRVVKTPVITDKALPENKNFPNVVSISSLPTPLPPILQGEDGTKLRLVPEGKIPLPENFGPDSGKSVRVGPFYMDETQVTNHQYVVFLNRLGPRITVEKGVVRGDVNIWLLLGEVVGGYEPVIFRNGKFRINDPSHASSPVLRVTAYGASAYARYYGRRLPTAAEWFYAASKGESLIKERAGDISQTTGEQETDEMMRRMHEAKENIPSVSQEPLREPTPVLVFRPNAFGIRGLNEGFSEWGLQFKTIKTSLSEQIKEVRYVVLGGLGKDTKKGTSFPAPISRYPWEAFEEVGFRTVLSVDKSQD